MMLRRVSIFICVLAVFGCGGGGVVSVPSPPTDDMSIPPIDESAIATDATTGDRYISNQILVVFRDGVSEAAVDEVIRTIGGEKTGRIPVINAYQIRIPSGTTLDALIQRYAANPSVESAGRLILPDLAQLPPEYNPTDFWGLDRIDAERAWPITMGRGVTVAVVDTGVRASHVDLREPYAGGRDFWSGRDPTNDTVGHGTAVASIIAAVAGGGGSLGVAPQARILSYRVGSMVGPLRIINPFAVSAAIISAANSGVRIINVSLGTRFGDLPDRIGAILALWNRAIRHARSRGSLVVVAAGNGPGNVGQPHCAPPAQLTEAICVVATDRNNQRAPFSNFGPEADVAAPGVEIRAASSSSDTAVSNVDGTSVSAPLVSGTIALMLSVNSSLTADQIVAILQRTAMPSGAGVGIVNAERAVLEARGVAPSPTPTAGPTPTMPPTPPPPTTEYHYNVWRGGGEAINRGVAWAAESFVARFNTISRVTFNAGGPSNGPWANSATVFLYSNEAMTQQVAAVFVPDINDYGETVAVFPNLVSVNVGQRYWLQVHTGQASVRILLYASIFGGDYPSGCAYWHDFNANTVLDCAVDLNLRIQR